MAMIKGINEGIQLSEDDFWSCHLPLFTTQFPTYYTKPQKVWGRFHTSDEKYFDSSRELIPLKHRSGTRTYVMMQSYVLEPNLIMSVRLYKNPKKYADQESPIGKTAGTRYEGFRQAQVGSAQAWYYPEDKIIVLWECFFDSRFRRHPIDKDRNMRQLWQSFEHFLTKQFPKAETLATPFNDPVARSIEEYQTFLKSLDYSPLARAVFGKKI